MCVMLGVTVAEVTINAHICDMYEKWRTREEV